MADEKNKGGFLSGLGYLGQSLLAGIGNIGEGAIDAILAPLADLTGNHEFAESLFKKNWVGDWYSDVTEDFNPGTGWEFAGNVAHGLGQSAYLFIPYAGAPIFFSGVMAQGISSAAQQTGDVGIKEAAYGLTTGAVEGALEYFGGAAVKGAKSIALSAGKSGAKGLAKSAIKSTVRKGLVKQVLSDAASEFTEEAMSEVIDVGLQRLYGINPDAQLSVKDVLYAGAVGAVSGAVTTSSVQIPLNLKNRARGEKIIKDGNSQTLVNTATSIADRLAGQGTDWDKAPEWAAAIRGQVDAYEKLSSAEKNGIRGQTLLGEMQSSLFFAEHQSVFNEVQKNIQNADEQKRATWAEYINKSVSKERRNNRDFTAEDVKNNTDNVAWQLAIYKYVPAMFNLDAAVVDLDTAQESGIADVVARNQGAESGAVVGTKPVAVGAEQYNLVGKDVNGNEIYKTSEETKKLPRKQRMRKFVDIMNNEYYGRTAKFTVDGETYYARFDQKDVNKNVYGDRRSDRKGYNAKIDVGADGNIFELVENAKYQDSRAESGKGTDAHKNVSEWDYFDKTVIIDGTQYDVLINIRKKDNGEYVYSVQLRESKKEASSSSRAHYDNSHSSNKEDDASSRGRTPPASANTLAETSKTSGRISTDNSIHQNESVVNPEEKEISSNDSTDENGKNLRSEAAEVVQGTSDVAQGANDVVQSTNDVADANNVATESQTEVDLERAKRDAERMIEWERKNAPTAEELNTVREYVKNFDILPADRQLAIVRMIRSSKGIDTDTVRGVANLMAITNKKGAVLAPDLEFRFAELADGVAKRGIKTEVGGKTVIVLNTNSTYKNTIRGSIAHEIVHYLENRKGYKALAEYAMKHAKAEKVAEVRETYKGVYKGENAEAKIEGEVVASVVAEMLGSEKFLKRYAQMGEEQSSVVKRIAKFVKGIANALKEKDKEAGAVAVDMMKLVDKALGSEVAGEKTGTKYSYAGEKAATADMMSLARAKRMLADSVDSETIRKETGWFKGYDGKWRFEIDDFESGLIENPKLKRHEDDGEIYFTGKLTDIFNHDALFKAYPELKNINIVIQKTEFGVYGIYQPNSNYITLSIEHFKRTTKEYYDYANGGRKAEIERIEATPEFQEYNSFYDKDADDIIDAQEWLRQEQELRDRFFSSELGKRYYQLMWGKSGFSGNKYEFGWGTGGKETLLHELQHAIQNIEGFASGTSTRDLNYSRNAGELEAYDTERRANLTAEERKNTRPDIDREDVVFAEGVSYYQASSIEEDEDVKSIRQQLKNAKDKLAEIAPAKSKYPPRAFKNAKEALDWAVNILKASGQLIQRQGYGDIVLDEKRLKNGLSYLKTDAEKVAFSLIPKVIKNGIEIGRHPKHKGRNYDTVTFALPVTVGNKTGYMAVVIREEGKKYFKLHRVFMPDGSLFEFTETEKSNAETAGLQNANLSPTNVASNNSIHQNEPVVNTSDEKSSDKEQYDLDLEAVEREAERLTPKTDKKGREVDDEHFTEAIARALREQNLSAEERRQLARQREQESREAAIESRKTKFEKILGRAYAIQKKIENLENTVGQDVNEAELKKLKKEYKDILGKMAGVQIDLRQMGYDLNAEQRLIERQKKQIENQSKEIGDLRAYKRNNERLERETAIIKEMEAREAARQARLFAKQKAEIGKVYSEPEIKREIKDMVDRGLISKFFGGQYTPKLSANKINAISRYITMQLNLAGSAEKAEVQGLIRVAALDVLQGIKFTDVDGNNTTLDKLVDADTVNTFADMITTDLVGIVRNSGDLNPHAEMVRKYRNLENEYNKLFKSKESEGEAWGKQFPKTVAQAVKMRKLATQKKGIGSDSVQKITKILGDLADESGRLRTGKIDEAMKEASTFFAGEALKMQSERGQLSEDARIADDNIVWSFHPDLQYDVERFIQMRKGRESELLNSEELKLLGDFLQGMRTTLERYNKEYVNGRWVDVDQAAGSVIVDMTRQNNAKTVVSKFLNTKLGKFLNNVYFYEILSPETVIESLEDFKSAGLLKTMYHDIRIAKQRALTRAARMKSPFADFLDAKEEIEVDNFSAKESLSKRYDQYGINITEDQISDNAEYVVNMETVHKLTGKEFEADGQSSLKEKVVKFFNQHDNKVESQELGTVALTKTSFSDDQGHGLTRNKIVSFAAIPTVLKEGKIIDVYKPDDKPYVRITVAAPITIEGQKYYMGVMVQKDNQSNRMYLHDVITEKATLSFTNGANHQDGEGIRDKGHLFITSILQKRLSVNTSEQKNKATKNNKIDPTWTDEKGHKRSFRAKLENKMIKIYGKEINLGEAIYLDMLMKREQSHLGLTENGYITYDDKGAEKTRVIIEDIADAHSRLIEQFDETDKAFLKMAEQFFNETASKIKYDADIKIFGYSNNESSYYVPIIRDRYSRMNGVTDMRQSVGSFVTVYNKSFTKNVVRNNKALEGKNIMRIINDHADGLADYAELYLPLKAFDRIYNHGIVTDGRPTSIRQVLNTQKWNGTEKYLKELFADIQGQSSGDVRNIDKAVAWVRSGWVNSVLGANLKVVATQTTSLGAATQVIDARYVTKCSWMITPGVGYAEGVKAIADRADKYSDIIFARSFDMGALRAQGNIDKVTDLGRKTGSLIEWMDRKVCIALFHAAELQVEAQTEYKVGTEENATRAAKLADEAIYTTQSMDSKAEKSALQRERSEIAKLFSMFTSDTVKNLSHLWGNFMKWNAHRNRVKNGEASYQAELKKDGRAIKRSLRTMAITGVMIGLITQGFKYLYGKEEEETEDKLKDFAVDITSSTLNVFPIVSEFVDKIFLDYDLSVNVLDVVNDTLDAVGGGFDVMGSVFAGEYVSDQKIVKTSANVLKSGASLLGIPVAPVERTITGLLRRFSPSTIYGYDSMMSNPSYSADLQAAVKSGDDALAEHILETIYKNEATGVYSTPELEEVARLYGLGNTSVIPQKIGATVNDVKLDRKQRAQFEKIYGEASAKVNELIRSEYYAELDDEQRAKAIKTIYALFYNRAAAEVAGVEWSNAQAYSRLTDNYAALFAAQAYKSGLKPYKTLRGKEVSVKDQFVDYVENLRLSDADKLVVLYANGYRDAKTKKKMLAYINALSISEDEKAKIAERLGFAVENGKAVEKKKELEVRER